MRSAASAELTSYQGESGKRTISGPWRPSGYVRCTVTWIIPEDGLAGPGDAIAGWDRPFQPTRKKSPHGLVWAVALLEQVETSEVVLDPAGLGLEHALQGTDREGGGVKRYELESLPRRLVIL